MLFPFIHMPRIYPNHARCTHTQSYTGTPCTPSQPCLSLSFLLTLRTTTIILQQVMPEACASHADLSAASH